MTVVSYLTISYAIECTTMNHLWLEFLRQQGACYIGNTLSHFSEPQSELAAAAQSTIITALCHRSMVRVTGDDAIGFMQGQLTNDVTQVADNYSQLSGYCNPKGRLFSILRLYRLHGDLYFSLPESLAEATLDRLRKYVLMAKVQFEPTEDMADMGIAGVDAESLLSTSLGDFPAQSGNAIHNQGYHVVRLPGQVPRFEIFSTPQQLMALWQSLRKNENVWPTGLRPWQWLAVRAGEPQLFPATQEEFIPQMMNFDAVDGLSFTKGCYPGQEIVARMNYLGTLKRRMFLMHGDGEPTPEGSDVYNARDPSQPVGKIAASQAAPGNGFDCLAVLKIQAVEQGDLRAGSVDGIALQRLQLPYSLPAKT